MNRTTKTLFLTSTIFQILILITSEFDEVSTNTFQINLDPYWDLYKKVFGKSYHDDDEEDKRRLLWEDRVMESLLHNIRYDLGLESFTRGCNAYSDLTDDEVEKQLKGYKNIDYKGNSTAWIGVSNLGAPSSVDSRNDGLVTGVKDQSMCGACWAFSAIGSLEGQHKKRSGNLVPLSEQQLVDCSTDDVNDGCYGGLMAAAFEYMKNSEGVDSEKSYPYTARNHCELEIVATSQTNLTMGNYTENEQGECDFKPDNVVLKITGYVELPSGDEKALRDAVASVGPISVAIDARHESFMSYKNGIYDEPECSSTQMDHAVTIIGYGTEDDTDYWLLKNSWGTSWGMKGFMKIARNSNNMCGIASRASYPLV